MSPRRRELQILIKPYSVPLLFVKEESSNVISSTGGTALLWQSIDGNFIVGAAHVWREFEQRRATNGRMSICIGLGAGTPVSLLNANPIAIDDELDIVVLPAPAITPSQLTKKSFYRTAVWPLAPATNDETVGFIGFPGEWRETNGLTLETSSFYYENTCAVTAAGKLRIGSFQEEPPMTVYHSDNVKKLTDSGGASGAPVFALRASEPVWVGVVKRGPTQWGEHWGVEASPAHLLGSDGKFHSAERQR